MSLNGFLCQFDQTGILEGKDTLSQVERKDQIEINGLIGEDAYIVKLMVYYIPVCFSFFIKNYFKIENNLVCKHISLFVLFFSLDS